MGAKAHPSLASQFPFSAPLSLPAQSMGSNPSPKSSCRNAMSKVVKRILFYVVYEMDKFFSFFDSSVNADTRWYRMFCV